MNFKEIAFAILILTGVLMFTGFVEGILVDHGLVNPIVGGITLPVVTAAIIVFILLILQKQKVDAGAL